MKQARTTVTYRFSLPEEPARVLLPTSYSAARCVRIPVEPKTITFVGSGSPRSYFRKMWRK